MTINLNGVEFYSAQEVDARIREAIAGKDKEVDMTDLPIGALVKVVDNRAGHGHEVGEILPITEVGEDVDEPGYRLDDRLVGWVNVEDIELVSFPEEEESTSGDEGLAVDEDGAEIKAGDIVIATEDELDITKGVEYEIKKFKTGTLYFLDDDGDIRHVSVHEDRLRKKSDKRGFKKRFNGFEIGDILLSHIESHQITDGKHYEVVAVDCDGDAVIMDDNGRVYYIDVSAAGDGKFEVL